MIARIFALACACLIAAQAPAADRGFYFGITGGRAEYDFERPTPTVILPPPEMPGPIIPGPIVSPVPRPPIFIPEPPGFAVAGPALAEDGHDTAWAALAGYRIAKYVAAELAYVDLGKLTSRWEGTLPSGSEYSIRRTLATRGPTLTVLGILPVTDAWDIYLRAGAFSLDSKLETTIDGGISGGSSTTYGSDGLVWGGGMQFAFGKHWSARLDFQRYQDVGQRFNPGRAEVDVFSLGVLYAL